MYVENGQINVGLFKVCRRKNTTTLTQTLPNPFFKSEEIRSLSVSFHQIQVSFYIIKRVINKSLII